MSERSGWETFIRASVAGLVLGYIIGALVAAILYA